MPSTWTTKYPVCNSSPWRSCWSPEATSHNWDRVCPHREYERLSPHSHHSCQVAFRWHVGGEILAEDWRRHGKRQRPDSVVFQHSSLREICRMTTRDRQRERQCVCVCVWLLATLKGLVYPGLPLHPPLISCGLKGLLLGAPVHTVAEKCIKFSNSHTVISFQNISYLYLKYGCQLPSCLQSSESYVKTRVTRHRQVRHQLWNCRVMSNGQRHCEAKLFFLQLLNLDSFSEERMTLRYTI